MATENVAMNDDVIEVNDLNLEAIVIKSMDPLEGEGWSFEYAQEVENEYRRFLTLCKDFPDEPIVPSSIVDKMWHLHILDTRKYVEDCTKFLGYFLHHFPYFGMRGKQDEDNLDYAWQKTLDIYKNHFDEKPNVAFWPESVRCPNCGKRSATNAYSEERPSYKSMGLTPL